jgi:hypothetical protein
MLYTNRYITSYMETLLNTLSPIFEQYDFHSHSHSNSNNKICYKSASPYDEFIVEMFPKTNEIVTIVPVSNIPLGSVPYKKTFIDMNTAIDYMKMHLNHYQASNSN